MKRAILYFTACAFGGFCGGLLLAVVIVSSVQHFSPIPPITTGRSR